MTKKELRTIYLERRSQLSPEACSVLSQKICEHFFALPLDSVKVLHTFLPIIKNNEPDTWLIISRLKQEQPSVRISLPKVMDTSGVMKHFYFSGKDNLVRNAWGIDEPAADDETPVKDIDLVLVPLLTYNHQGQRVGYGKGFYDRFLSECRPNCRRIGISLFNTPEVIDDVSEHDVPLHQCITPSGIINF